MSQTNGPGANFDQTQYWLNRHETLRGDPRSVGNLSSSLEQNIVGAEKLKSILHEVAAMVGRSSVLDLGCGYGRAAGPFINSGYAYTGVDVSPVALEAARSAHPTGSFVKQDLALWTPESTFDLVLLLYVCVHFVDDAAWERFVRASLEAVRPGGFWIIADHFPAEREAKVAHVVARPRGAYDKILGEYGLRWDDGMATELRHRHPGGGQTQQFAFARRG